MSTKDHKNILASIFFFLGFLQTLIWVMIGGFYGYEWMILLYGLFYMFVGFQIHNRKSGAKPLGIIASLLCLPSFPIGTAIGIYGMWCFIYGDKDSY